MSNLKKRKKQYKSPRRKFEIFMSSAEFQDLKDKVILTGWIIGILLLISLLWVLTQGPQTFSLLRTVNNVLINNNDTRRISGFFPVKTAKADLPGYWYNMLNTTDKMFVFTVFRDGLLVPAGAVVSANGRTKEIIPLSSHAAQIFDSIPESILQMYIKRIEESSLSVFPTDAQSGDVSGGGRR